ncbi:MAG: polymorphic toxin-type HINT domain-containing protein [Phycisphaeraceae bacterium]
MATGTLQLSIVHGVDWLAGGGANSFAAGTGVVTGIAAHGEPVTTPIQHLQVGDVVLANDELNPNGEPYYALVTAVSHRTVYEHHTLTYIDDAGNTETLQTTPNHAFFALTPTGGSGWTQAEHLQPGDQLLLPDGSLATVTANTPELMPAGVEVYNLTVSDGSTYYVDDGQGEVAAVWVHNAVGRALHALGLVGVKKAVKRIQASPNWEIIGREVTVKSSVTMIRNGKAVTKNVRTRIDLVIRDTQGRIVLVEVKTGVFARLTKNQRLAFPIISKTKQVELRTNKIINVNGLNLAKGDILDLRQVRVWRF